MDSRTFGEENLRLEDCRPSSIVVKRSVADVLRTVEARGW
jgi:hypothetical protein